MSAGEFTTVAYQATYNAANFHPIKVQEETPQATIGGQANAAGAGPINNPISAKVGKTKREFGLGPRMISLEFTGALPDGYTGDPVTIPALTSAFYNAAIKGATGTYLGSPVKVLSQRPEDVR